MKRSSAMSRVTMTCLMLLSISSTVLFSCDKDNDDGPDASDYIQESEALVLPAIIELPENPPAGNSRVATYYAVGVQKYKAEQVAGTSTFKWVFVAPQADLYNASNQKVGTHSAGPTWQLSANDSIYAQHYAPMKAFPAPNTIDWLLLKPKEGKTPTGIFAGVDYIQRIATHGGKAPAEAPLSAAETVQVPYTAVYRFSKINP